MRLTFVATIVLALAAMPYPAAARFVQRWPAESAGSRFVIRPVPVQPVPEIEALNRTIEEGRDAGQLDRKTARRLRGEASRMARAARRNARDGMTPAELHELRVWAIVTKERTDLLRAEMSVPGR
jgi:hypothetical protein